MGVIAIADADFAGLRGATLEGFGAMSVRQFEMREPAASEVEHGQADLGRDTMDLVVASEAKTTGILALDVQFG